jgi:hypothetical protein
MKVFLLLISVCLSGALRANSIPPTWTQIPVVLTSRVGAKFCAPLISYVTDPDSENLTFKINSDECAMFALDSEGTLCGGPFPEERVCLVEVQVSDEASTVKNQVKVTINK